ncbi:MAG: glycosyltransferase family 39 protein [Bacillus sp. (in: Bacteria)]|nr:glycosyltransferase family 39 protein [Bacillus sp. (in: firmicutes)]MCM1427809.1 glycosyltransferase family 39 protein [Eubacterium sp.]
MTDTGVKKSRLWFYIFLIAWAAQMIAAVYFCCQKKGFFEDEYYSYYSTSRTYGLFVEDNTWAEHDDYYREFVVLENQGFQYALVKLVQSWDVHPPVYYWILHTVCSLFPGQFSKWFGLIINLAAFGVSMFLLRLLALYVTRRDEKLSFLVCLFYGFTPAAMSSVVFIRMYALLTVFVLLCAILHIRMIESGREKLPFKTFLLPIAVVTYLGFLTQYYYFIFLFFMAVAFCIYLLWRDKNLRNCFRYGISIATAFVLAYLTYPSCLGQMFRGQRGAQATGNFFDISNTYERLQFFWELLDEYVFGKTISVFLLAIVLLLLYIVRKERVGGREYVASKENTSYRALLFTTLGYFLVVSKTGLLLGDTSIRYQTPVYGIIVLLLFTAVKDLALRCEKGVGRQVESKEKADGARRRESMGIAAAVIVCLIINLTGYLNGRVVFLYPEDEEKIAFAGKMAAQKTPVVYLFDEGQSWCVWDSADEFFEYDKIYFSEQSHTEPIMDTEIADSDDLVVYVSSTADSKAQLRRIMESNPNLSGYELQYQEKYCDVYYFR